MDLLQKRKEIEERIAALRIEKEKTGEKLSKLSKECNNLKAIKKTSGELMDITEKLDTLRKELEKYSSQLDIAPSTT